MNDTLPKMLAPDDVRKHLHIGRGAAYELFKSPSFPAIRINNRWRVSEPTYLEWLREREELHVSYNK